MCDVILLYAKTNPELGHRGISAFIVEKGFPGFSVGRKIDKLGIRGSPTNELIFEDCEVPVENVIGEINKGVYILMSGLDFERITLSAGAIGIMQSAWDSLIHYIQTDQQL